ncbi:hypothetical protein N7494_012294 [Penicillium frequentans]|uniref:Zn(2)-C6 fungal-type domain-containing protein n=1 Tax=Penicillium frequentans TaxID=3151616 RepID=A0AAD6CNY8_9EURO|nr:hypothetical protein N7494_012294 [Penicillium glabrum]
MKTSRYATSRQKACQHCSVAKAKCDRKATGCSRCAKRKIPCVYPQTRSSKEKSPSQGGPSPQSPDSIPDSLVPSFCGLPPDSHSEAWTEPWAQPVGQREHIRTASSNTLTSNPISFKKTELDFSNLELFCPINTDEITTRWMNPYIPVPGQTIKQYPSGVSSFISRILKSYTAVAARGRGTLPFVHPSQISEQPASSPLTTCLSLIKICETPLPGSEGTAAMVLQREMGNIMECHESYNELSLLGAFQAYLIYCLALFFKLHQGPQNQLRSAMMNLQTLAHLSSKQGLMCVADQDRTRPKWEEWIVTETKRRTLYVMYLFDSVLSTQEALPTFLATELLGLPSSASKLLWHARSRSEWEREYNIHLAEWTDKSLTIDELWPVPPDMDAPDIARRSRRVDHWLEEIDEFGTMLYAVTSCTHGG